MMNFAQQCPTGKWVLTHIGTVWDSRQHMLELSHRQLQEVNQTGKMCQHKSHTAPIGLKSHSPIRERWAKFVCMTRNRLRCGLCTFLKQRIALSLGFACMKMIHVSLPNYREICKPSTSKMIGISLQVGRDVNHIHAHESKRQYLIWLQKSMQSTSEPIPIQALKWAVYGLLSHPSCIN